MSEVREIIQRMQEEENSGLYEAKRWFVIGLPLFVVGWGINIGITLLPPDFFMELSNPISIVGRLTAYAGSLYFLFSSIRLLWLSRRGGAGRWPLYVVAAWLVLFGTVGLGGYYFLALGQPSSLTPW